MIVVEKSNIVVYLKKRNLTKQYLKVKQDICDNNLERLI